MSFRFSLSRGQAAALCPVCSEETGDLDVEAVATVGHAENERGTTAFLEGFACDLGHALPDLSAAQEVVILENAIDSISELRKISCTR